MSASRVHDAHDTGDFVVRKEPFYIGPDQKLMAVSVTTDPSFAASAPRPLFQLRVIPLPPTQPRQQCAVSTAGDRFRVNTMVEPTAPSPVTIILNWDAVLKK